MDTVSSVRQASVPWGHHLVALAFFDKAGRVFPLSRFFEPFPRREALEYREGLYYFNARWYDAELARFTTEDPARDDINWYVYCANNPMTHTDLTGMQFTGDYGETSDGNYDLYDGDRVPTTKDWAEKVPTQDQCDEVGEGLNDLLSEFLIAVGASGSFSTFGGVSGGAGFVLGFGGEGIQGNIYASGAANISSPGAGVGLTVTVVFGSSDPDVLTEKVQHKGEAILSRSQVYRGLESILEGI